MITDDAELVARAVIMSGAYEHNWSKHAIVGEEAAKWQNKLPLYNLRMQNLSACVIRPQLPELARRVENGRANPDYGAARLTDSGYFTVPAPLAPELRAPDSIQFNLNDFTAEQSQAYMDATKARGVSTQVFGQSKDNARAFWNWQFIPGDLPDLPQTRAMLAKACDTRLPARLTRDDLDYIADALIEAAAQVRG